MVVLCRLISDLLPVWSDDADVFGGDGRQALLAIGLQQFPHIAHEHLHLRYVEEGRTAGLALVNTGHTLKDNWEALRVGEMEVIFD